MHPMVVMTSSGLMDPMFPILYIWPFSFPNPPEITAGEVVAGKSA